MASFSEIENAITLGWALYVEKLEVARLKMVEGCSTCTTSNLTCLSSAILALEYDLETQTNTDLTTNTYELLLSFISLFNGTFMVDPTVHIDNLTINIEGGGGGGGGTGTVTSVSAVDSPGINFTVSNPTTTPEISLSLTKEAVDLENVPNVNTSITDNINEGATNKWWTNARSISSVLTGYVKSAVNRAVLATDTILSAFGILEKKIDDNTTAIAGKEPTINGTTSVDYFRGDKTFANLNSAVLARVLTGLNVSGASIVNTDTLLEAFGKLQSQINGVLGGAIYISTWNAATNSPALADGTGTKGHYYVVSVDGNINLGSGVINFKVGDWAIYNGAIWQKVDNTDAVASVNGYIGAVNLTSADISEVTNLYFTTARVLATTLTGYVSGAGTVEATDTILQAIQKLNGNISAIVKASIAEVNTGTDDAKFATPASLEGSKYLTQSGAKLSATTTGTDTYTATINPAITAYVNTHRFFINFTNANTIANPTLALNGLAAKGFVNADGTAIAIGALKGIVCVAYNGTAFQIVGGGSGGATLSTDGTFAANSDLVAPSQKAAKTYVDSKTVDVTVPSGEKVLTVTSAGVQKTYDLIEPVVSAAALTAADWSTGLAAVTGVQMQTAYDTNYKYECVGTNQWRRIAWTAFSVDLYLADIDDSGGIRTSAQLNTAFPTALVGQKSKGNAGEYEKYSTSWRYNAQTAV